MRKTQKELSEDDTFDRLRRIPISELINRHGPLIDFVYSIVRDRIEANEKSIFGKRKSSDLIAKIGFDEESIDKEFEGSGWTCDALVVEIEKNLALKKLQQKENKKKRFATYLWIFLLCQLFTNLVIATNAPAWLFIGTACLSGVLGGMAATKLIKRNKW